MEPAAGSLQDVLLSDRDIRAEVDTRLRKGLGLPVVERIDRDRDRDREKADVVQMPEKKKA